MNIAFFLTPKSELVVLEEHMTIRQAMEKMEHHRYTAVPVINREGIYVGTLSEGDILWHLKHKEGVLFKDTEKETVEIINRHRDPRVVEINSDMEALFELTAIQSFVPVVDDQHVFIGIIKRSDILQYCLQKSDLLKGEDKSTIVHNKLYEYIKTMSYNHQV